MASISERTGGYLAPEFTALAHRGGALLPANLGIENTIAAFAHAVELGFRYLETDVHATRDGVLVAFHDSNLLRVTDMDISIADVTAAELSQIRIGGREPIPTVDELLEAFPDCSLNIDIKADAATVPLARAIDGHAATDRVCVGSFSPARIQRFRRLMPDVVTSVSPAGVGSLLLGRVGSDRRRPARVYQVPLTHRVAGVELRVVTPARVRAIHRAGRKIHVWTVDDPEVMHELIDWGVDGIVTDRPDLLKRVLRNRGMWSTSFGA